MKSPKLSMNVAKLSIIRLSIIFELSNNRELFKYFETYDRYFPSKYFNFRLENIFGVFFKSKIAFSGVGFHISPIFGKLPYL